LKNFEKISEAVGIFRSWKNIEKFSEFWNFQKFQEFSEILTNFWELSRVLRNFSEFLSIFKSFWEILKISRTIRQNSRKFEKLSELLSGVLKIFKRCVNSKILGVFRNCQKFQEFSAMSK
jgi:hypothetical protein